MILGGKFPDSYRGYDFMYLGDEVFILHAKEIVDSAPNYEAATIIIDGWLNAP